MRVELKDIKDKKIKICEDSIPFEYEIRIIAEDKEEAKILEQMEKETWQTGWDKNGKYERLRF